MPEYNSEVNINYFVCWFFKIFWDTKILVFLLQQIKLLKRGKILI